MIAPHRETLLLAGASGGGKSTFTQSLTERLAAKGFRFCILDPEGDYEGLPEAVGVGTGDRPPELGEIIALLRKTQTDVVVNILGVPLDDRPAFFAKLLSELTGLRAQLGRPDVIIVDEAHHMLPAHWDPGAAALPQAMEGFLFISTMPSSVLPRLPEAIDRLLIVGSNPQETLDMFCRTHGVCDLSAPDNFERGQILSIDVKAQSLKRLNVISDTGQHLRHRWK
jgi:hypothetical protein